LGGTNLHGMLHLHRIQHGRQEKEAGLAARIASHTPNLPEFLGKVSKTIVKPKTFSAVSLIPTF
jgi:hypothetical protein